MIIYKVYTGIRNFTRLNEKEIDTKIDN